MNFEKNIINIILSSTTKYKKFLIAYSGGLDSSVLLYLFNKIKNFEKNIEIRAIHIDHYLNKESESWSNHCLQECKILNIKIDILKIEKNIKKNIESTYRYYRYKYFKENLYSNEILVTAHHLNDQVETFFLALKRSSGPLGLSAMKKFNVINNIIIFRPFLDFSKNQIQLYAKKKHIKWIKDKNNKNEKFDRNFLRKQIIPKFINRWPFFLRSVYKSTKLCYEQEKIINYLIYNKFKYIINKDNSLNIIKLKNINSKLIFYFIRKWIMSNKFHNIILSYNQVKSIWNNVALSKLSSDPIFKFKNLQIRRFKNKLYILEKMNCIKNFILIWFDLSKILILPNNIGYLKISNIGNMKIRLPHKNELINIRFYEKNKVSLINNKYHKKINRIFKELNIPQWERYRIPLLFYNEKLIIAINIFETKNNIIKNNLYFFIEWHKF